MTSLANRTGCWMFCTQATAPAECRQSSAIHDHGTTSPLLSSAEPVPGRYPMGSLYTLLDLAIDNPNILRITTSPKVLF